MMVLSVEGEGRASVQNWEDSLQGTTCGKSLDKRLWLDTHCAPSFKCLIFMVFSIYISCWISPSLAVRQSQPLACPPRRGRCLGLSIEQFLCCPFKPHVRV